MLGRVRQILFMESKAMFQISERNSRLPNNENLFSFIEGLAIVVSLFLMGDVKADAHASTIRFAEEANWPPFTNEPDGQASVGFSVELVNLVFGHLGVVATVDLYPQKRMLEQIKQGLRDGATVISKNIDRESFILFSDPIFEKRGLVYYRLQSDELFEWRNFEDFQSMRIATVLGHNNGEAFEAARTAVPLSVIEVSSVESALKMLNAGRVDVVFVTEWSAQAVLKENPQLTNIAVAQNPYISKTYHIGLSKTSSFVSLLPEINRVISKIKEDGALQALKERYLYN